MASAVAPLGLLPAADELALSFSSNAGSTSLDIVSMPREEIEQVSLGKVLSLHRLRVEMWVDQFTDNL